MSVCNGAQIGVEVAWLAENVGEEYDITEWVRVPAPDAKLYGFTVEEVLQLCGEDRLQWRVLSVFDGGNVPFGHPIRVIRRDSIAQLRQSLRRQKQARE